MALAAVQAALARLFTDEHLRAAFLDDPHAASLALGLDDVDRATLSMLAPHELRRFSASLMGKRTLDARKVAPLTAQTLGKDFAAKLRIAMKGPSMGPRGASDIAALADLLRQEAASGELSPPWVADLARYEAACLQAPRSAGLSVRIFAWPVGRVVTALRLGTTPRDAHRGVTLCVWFRPRRASRLRHWIVPLGF
jgi:hypothetical protein